MAQQLLHILDAMAGKRVMIIGDVMIDRYLIGKVSRISPEAPVPVVQFEHEDHRLGGAANVALNINALGGIPLLCGMVGDDHFGQIFLERLRQINLPTTGIITSMTRPTTVKTRIIGNGQQILRIDREEAGPLAHSEAKVQIEQILDLILQERPDAIIFEDYDKGFITEPLADAVLELAKTLQIPTTIDPKKRNFYLYKGATLFKPNLKEIRDSVPFEVKPDAESLQHACNYLRSKLNHTYTLITLSEKGVYFEAHGQGRIFPTFARQVSDVSGAGDTVIAIATLALTSTIDGQAIAQLSNLAGGQVCEKPEVVPVNLDELRKEIGLAEA